MPTNVLTEDSEDPDKLECPCCGRVYSRTHDVIEAVDGCPSDDCPGAVVNCFHADWKDTPDNVVAEVNKLLAAHGLVFDETGSGDSHIFTLRELDK